MPKCYKWFQLQPVTIPSDNVYRDYELNHMVEPYWNGKQLNPYDGFQTIEAAETALEQWKQYDPQSYGDYFLQTCY